MKRRDEWVVLSKEDIEKEIAARRVLIGQMVGQLYPSILADEIHDLNELRRKLEDKTP